MLKTLLPPIVLVVLGLLGAVVSCVYLVHLGLVADATGAEAPGWAGWWELALSVAALVGGGAWLLGRVASRQPGTMRARAAHC